MSANFMMDKAPALRRLPGMWIELLNRLRMSALIFISLLSFLSQSAHANPEEQATNAALADLGTTGVALSLGAVETNPLGIMLLPVKYGLLKYAEKMPDGDKQEMQSTMTAVWSGASVNNACVILSILTAGAFAPVCILAGVAVGIGRWQSSSSERKFWRTCSDERKATPTLLCEYSEPVPEAPSRGLMVSN